MDFVVPIATYVAVSNPATYKLTSGILGQWVANSAGTPNIGGLILHAIVFILLTGFLLGILVPATSKYGGRGGFGTPCSNSFDCQGQCVTNWWTRAKKCTSR